jgi:Outer membrane lipoprotein carrier protein LolA-like
VWTLLLLAPWTIQAAPDTSVLIDSIKRPVPASVAFTEVRFSHLFKQPTIVAGHLGYLGAQQLDRTVERPYREHTEIRGDSVRIVREGEPERSFAIKRSPELRVMLLAFSAILSGDHVAIEHDFSLHAEGDLDHWSLELKPIDSRLQHRLERVSIIGSRDAPSCLSIYTHDGGVSVMLLAALASTQVSPNISQEALLQRCGSEH